MLSSAHNEFIHRTDRQSLCRQMQNYIKVAKQSFEADVQIRREMMRDFLGKEDRAYEEEFAQNVRSASEKNIRRRFKQLRKIKEENKRLVEEFLRKKLLQREMEACSEVREAVRAKELAQVKICQKEQILENERKVKRQQELDEYWLNVHRKNIECFDRTQAMENCLKRKMDLQTKDLLDWQLEQAENRRKEDERIKAEEVEKMAKHVDTLRKERFDMQYKHVSQKEIEYRNELEGMIQEKKRLKKTEENERAEEHRRMIAELQRIECEENALIGARKREYKKSLMDYIAYMKRMREMEAKQEQMRWDRIDDLSRIDRCTKSSIVRETKRKAEIAGRCYAELKRQVCDEYERRLREEALHKENKMLENRFGRPNLTHAEIQEKYRKQREALDQQIIDLKAYREKEEAALKEALLRGIDDRQICQQLGEEFMKHHVDYLEPHINWRILACPDKEYVPKPPRSPEEAATCHTSTVLPCPRKDKAICYHT